jgi:hypothetical protein
MSLTLLAFCFGMAAADLPSLGTLLAFVKSAGPTNYSPYSHTFILLRSVRATPKATYCWLETPLTTDLLQAANKYTNNDDQYGTYTCGF